MVMLELHVLSQAEVNTAISQLDKPRHHSGKTVCEGLNEHSQGHGLKDEKQELSNLTYGPYTARL
jgi:hypothetical protein